MRARRVTVLAYGTMVYVAEAAAAETGIDAEIIDLRTLLPLDLETIVASVRKTGRCVVVHEATLTSGFGAELTALVQEHCFYHLEAPIARVTGWDTPYPHAQEWDYFPGPARVGRALLEGHGGLRWPSTSSSFPMSAKAWPRPSSSNGTSRSATSCARTPILAAVMTDKATVEIPSPVDGEVLWLGAEVGDVVAVGSTLVRLDVAGEGVDSAPLGRRARSAGAGRSKPSAPAPEPTLAAGRSLNAATAPKAAVPRTFTGAAARPEGEKPLALAGRPPAGARGRHRPASGHRHRACRPHHP